VQRAHGNNDQAHIHEIKRALQLRRDWGLEVDVRERDVRGQRVCGQELLGGDVEAVEGVGRGRDGGEVGEPDTGAGGDVGFAGVWRELGGYGGVQEVAD
jgi:hypothetical protein